jgi:hypothetical protein
MKITRPFAILLFAAILGWCPPSPAQQSAKSKATQNAAPTNTTQADASPPPGWVARCSSPSRSALLDCAVEETAVLTKTGQ